MVDDNFYLRPLLGRLTGTCGNVWKMQSAMMLEMNEESEAPKFLKEKEVTIRTEHSIVRKVSGDN